MKFHTTEVLLTEPLLKLQTPRAKCNIPVALGRDSCMWAGPRHLVDLEVLGIFPTCIAAVYLCNWDAIILLGLAVTVLVS